MYETEANSRGYFSFLVFPAIWRAKNSSTFDRTNSQELHFCLREVAKLSSVRWPTTAQAYF
jgi:hypothetical protein